MKDYDARQLKLMYFIINQFESKSISLNQLASNLRALLELVEIDFNWKKQFYDKWWELEQMNAVQLDRGYAELGDDREIRNILSKLKQSIQELLPDIEQSSELGED